jgi:hypothetical protein
MKLSGVASAGVGVLILVLLVFGFVVVKPALAQVDATSTDPEAAPVESVEPASSFTSDTTTAEPGTQASEGPDTSPPQQAAAAESPASEAAPSDTCSQPEPTESPPAGFAEVRIIGTKYIDYFTDGTTITAYPGNPEIAAHFTEKDAPIPTHEGLTWVHTTGGHLYDN